MSEAEYKDRTKLDWRYEGIGEERKDRGGRNITPSLWFAALQQSAPVEVNELGE